MSKKETVETEEIIDKGTELVGVEGLNSKPKRCTTPVYEEQLKNLKATIRKVEDKPTDKICFALIKHQEEKGKLHYHYGYEYIVKEAIRTVGDTLKSVGIHLREDLDKSVIDNLRKPSTADRYNKLLLYFTHETPGALEDVFKGKKKLYKEEDIICNITRKELHTRRLSALKQIFTEPMAEEVHDYYVEHFEECREWAWTDRAKGSNRSKEAIKEEKQAMRKKYLEYREKLWREEITLDDIKENDLNLYLDHRKELNSIAIEVVNRRPLPTNRVNILITGEGGAGKGTLSKMLAACLSKTGDLSKKSVFFAGGDNVLLEKYSGQQIIVYNDKRAGHLLRDFKGKDGTYTFFDNHPDPQNYNVKNDSVLPVNEINIINNAQSYEDFVRVMGEAEADGIREDYKQVYRRFPIHLTINEDTIIYKRVTKCFDDTCPSYAEFEEYRINFQMHKFAINAVGRIGVFKSIGERVFAKVLEDIRYLLSLKNEMTDEEIIAMFENCEDWEKVDRSEYNVFNTGLASDSDLDEDGLPFS